jgi:3',5'-cyclic AMP phosphodiesterase CpdA
VKLIHISDLHFGTEVPNVCNALVTAIHEAKPDMIVVSGDISQRAKNAEFLAAQEFLANFSVPMLVIPGNHDIPLYNLFARFTRPYAKFCHHFIQREPIVSVGPLVCVGLDATTPFLHTHGRLVGDKLRERVRLVRLDYPQESHLLALVIHQPMIVPKEYDKKDLLLNSQEHLEDVLKLKVDLILSGHIHLPYCASVPNSQSHPWNFIFCGAGTAVSHRVRDGRPNSFYSFDIEKHSHLKVFQYDYQTDVKCFLPVATLDFEKNTEGWNLVEPLI